MSEMPWGTDQNISDDEFFNRERELDEFKSLLNTTKNGHGPGILLTGVRGVGKTVFLKKIKREMDNDYLIIHMDFSTAECYQKNNMNVIGLIEYYYKEIINEASKKGIKTLDKKINKFFSTKNYSIKDLDNINGFPIPIPEIKVNEKKLMDFVLNLPLDIYSENNKKIKGVIIFIDEIQIIRELNEYLESFLWILRSYIQNQNNVAYVLCGSMSVNDRLIYDIAGSGGVFGGRLLTINLEPFTEKTVKNYINEKMTYLKFSEDGFKRFYKCTGGIPSYINIFEKYLPRNTELTSEIVEKRFEKAIPQISSILYNLWYSLSMREQNIIISLIDKPLKRIEISEFLEVSSGSLSYSLNRLQNMGLITYENKKYVLNEKILGKWLKLEYKNKGIYPYR